ncbi:MAG: reverse transcriptase-like protein [Candidatus Pacebacteria bacterium]|nr:reverse transcriptase-like protein [Candidatus Paceibacterota bacterium]
MHFTIHADGGARGNPGPAGAGAVVRDHLGNIVASVSEYLGIRTNNYAEYEAVILALEKVHELAKGDLANTSVMVKMDSELVVKQMTGVYKIKHPDMQAQAARLKELAAPLGLISFAHVPRAQNSDADALANEAMDRGA